MAQHIRESWSGLTVRRHQGLLCGGPRTRQRCAIFRSPPVHVVSTPAVSSSALSWPAVPIPAELRQWQEDEAAKVMADAIKLVEDSAAEGARPEIKSELFFSAPVPTLVDLSKETQMVGCRGRGAFGSRLARFGQHRVDPPRPLPRRGDSRQSSVVDATGVGWD